jgi:hypothetical protein
LIDKKFPKAEIVHAFTTYDLLDSNGWSLEIKDGKQTLHVAVDNISGSFQLNRIAKPIALADVPKPVVEALQAKHLKATIKLAEEVQSGLIARRPGETKPLDYQLTVVTAEKETLIIYFEPEMKRNAKGENVPDPTKMRIDYETKVDEKK